MRKFKELGYSVPPDTEALLKVPCLLPPSTKHNGGKRHAYLLDTAQPVHLFVDTQGRTYREPDLREVTKLLEKLLHSTSM